jgi:hypothetical protein
MRPAYPTWDCFLIGEHMLRRLAIGLAGLAATAVTIAGCASGGANQTISVGPSFAPQSLYATNSTQNGISIYTSTTGGGPSYQISTGGSSSGLNGPQYLTFDSASDIFTTNWQPSLKVGGIVEIKAAATGNVLPFNSYSFGATHPRGIADYVTTPTGGTATDFLVVGVVNPTQPTQPENFSSQLQLFSAAVLGGPIETIAGPNTGLNVPSGVAVDKSKNIYVTNLQGASVEVFALPSPSASPSPTASPTTSPTASPTATPTGATASPSPTPSPTPTPVNIFPSNKISGANTGIGQPTGIAVDGSGNMYVSDQGSTSATVCAPKAPPCPAILIFPAGSTGNATPKFIAGSSTMLFSPTDVKVDSSGKIYVADSTTSGSGVIYVFASGANANVAPATTFTSPGTVIGLGLAP